MKYISPIFIHSWRSLYLKSLTYLIYTLTGDEGWADDQIRVARFFFVQHTKTGTNLPKRYKKVIKYPKWLEN
jgi:hypothetical protein